MQIFWASTHKPAKSLRYNPTPRIKSDPFPLQQHPLSQAGARHRAQADLAPRVDDPVPGHRAANGEGMQGVAHLPSVPRESGQCRDLAVGGHAAARNPADDGVDPTPRARGRSAGRLAFPASGVHYW